MGVLLVRVETPQAEVLSARADMVICRSVEGELAVLPGHEPMVASLAEGRLVVRTADRTSALVLSGATIDVSNDVVVVVADAVVDERDRGCVT